MSSIELLSFSQMPWIERLIVIPVTSVLSVSSRGVRRMKCGRERLSGDWDG